MIERSIMAVTCKMSYSSRSSSRATDCKVYVGDLGNGAAKGELERAFSYYGPLRSVWVARNPPGFAFVEYEDARDAEDAVKGMDGKVLCGARVRVELSTGMSRKSRYGRPSRRQFDPNDRCYQCGESDQHLALGPDLEAAATALGAVVMKESTVHLHTQNAEAGPAPRLAPDLEPLCGARVHLYADQKALSGGPDPERLSVETVAPVHDLVPDRGNVVCPDLVLGLVRSVTRKMVIPGLPAQGEVQHRFSDKAPPPLENITIISSSS
ncbi:splicing factor, arginine/serine-rich [Pimephales promelas]|nr:splicing factor, arginine/serine-rich [Pimephales promelas]